MKEKLVNVGIFWAVPNKWEGGWSFYEVKKTYQLSDANSLGFIDYPYSHYEKWDDVRSASETDDCYYYPRGRVLYNVNTGKHRIFADECLDECDLWELIEMFEIEDFELCRDEHYVSVFTQKNKPAVTPILEQAILIKGERSMETNFETVFTTRLIQIVGAKVSQLDDDAKMPNRAYDLFRRFTSKEDGANDLKKFAIMNGIWQEYLVKSVCKYDINFFEATQVIGRRKDIFKVNRQHDAQTDKTGTVEKRNCHWFCKNQQDKFPQIILYDREVPIVKQKTDREGATVDIVCTDNKPKPGKIDLVGADNDEMVIIEYKIASSPEPLLRAVAEIITYFHQIGGKNGATTYLEQFNKTFGLNCKKVGMAVAVPEIMYKAAHRYAFDLIQKYNIRCYSVDARSADEPETIEIKRIDEKRFAVTLSFLFERTKTRPYAEDDWRRIVTNIETRVKRSDSAQMMQRFENSLPEQIQAIYPLELSYKILDGEGRIGANLIEICYRKTKLLVECGLELEPTEFGKAIRENVLNSRYDACLVSHCHADHAGLIDKIEKKTKVYIGPTAKRILKITEKKKYDKVLTFNGKMNIGGITITPYLCDHSAMDSYMLYFSANGKSILYTGDFRGHGRKSYSALLSRLPQVDILICERTNPDGVKAWSEAKLQEKFEELMRENCDIYVLTGTMNADRIVTIYKASRKTRRHMLVDDTQAYRLNKIGGSIPHPRSHKEIKVVRPSATQKFSGMQPYTMLVRSSMTDALDKLLETRPDATLIYSMWSGYREKEDIKQLLEIFERRNCPIYTLHTSGHADSDAIQKLIDTIKPKEIKYVHGEV